MGNQDQDGRRVLPTDHDEGLDKTATKKWYYEFVAHQGNVVLCHLYCVLVNYFLFC